MLIGDSLEGAIVATVAYFDVFACAPRASEIHRFLIGERASRAQVERLLATRPELGRALGTKHDLWFLAGKDHLAPQRLRALEHSRRLWPEARAIARVIEESGLARTALVTGSLAADNADEHADLDFLLVYPAGRAFASFALTRLLSKLPGPRFRRFCPNYALPDDRLEIRPQNLFTAIELAKAVPLFGFPIAERLIHANVWARRLLPNAFPQLSAELPPSTRADGPLDRLAEWRWFKTVERFERRRKQRADAHDVGVDIEARETERSADRHSPTRSFWALSELRYRMRTLGIEGHRMYPELVRWTVPLDREMGRWGSEDLVEV